MRFFDYDAATLVRGAFGIAEPGPSARECPPGRIDLIVVPGTAFTEAGARMGRGRGYYDRYLAQPGFRAVKVGVCFAHQLVGGSRPSRTTCRWTSLWRGDPPRPDL